jgi:hypothetical protein
VRAPPDTGSDRPLLDKLGVKRGMRVVLIAFDDEGFRAQLAERGATVQEPSAGLDLVFFWAGQPGDLRRIGELRRLIHDAGAIWVLRAKGAARSVREVDVIDAARAFDLVDNKIASFSDTVAAMRLVVPLNQRRTDPVERERSS